LDALQEEQIELSIMVEHPTTYFGQWISHRSHLLQKMESEAADMDIPIVGPVVGRLLYLLARIGNARQILELGTAIGYSAIFMGEACRQNQGRITTFEIDPGMAERARVNIAEAGMSGLIEVRCQDVYDGLSTLAHPVDMVFMDIEKQDYVKLLPGIEKAIRPDGILVADNTGFQDAHKFNRAIHENTGWASVNLWSYLPGHSPEHDGICIAVKSH
jgi:caffeoyl-CoA O-methyltransferase